MNIKGRGASGFGMGSTGSVLGSCEHGNELSDSIKGTELLDQLNYYKLLKRDSYSMELGEEYKLRSYSTCNFLHHLPVSMTALLQEHSLLRNPRLHVQNAEKYEGIFKSFRTGHLEERELQMVQLSATRCSCIAIL